MKLGHGCYRNPNSPSSRVGALARRIEGRLARHNRLTGRRVREYGAGAGAGGHRLGHRRALDADAGELRACAGAAGSGRRRGKARGRVARMIRADASAKGRAIVMDSGVSLLVPLPASGKPSLV